MHLRTLHLSGYNAYLFIIPLCFLASQEPEKSHILLKDTGINENYFIVFRDYSHP